MDYLSKKHQFIFLNNRLSLVRVHVTQISLNPYNIWVEGKSKKYRDSIYLLKKTIITIWLMKSLQKQLLKMII